MNRAERRAAKRAKRNKGSGYTSKPIQRSMKQIGLMGIGMGRHQTVLGRIVRGELPLRQER